MHRKLMQENNDYQTALTTLHKLLRGAKSASEKGKYAALERIIQGAEKISEHLLSMKYLSESTKISEAIFEKQKLNRHFVDSFKNISSNTSDYIKVVGEIVS